MEMEAIAAILFTLVLQHLDDRKGKRMKTPPIQLVLTLDILLGTSVDF